MYRLFFNLLTRGKEKKSRLSIILETFIIKKYFYYKTEICQSTKIDNKVVKVKHFIPLIKRLIFILSCVVS